MTFPSIIPVHQIGDLVKSNEIIAEIEGVPVKTKLSGVLRGLIYSDTRVTKGMKVGDIDPRGIREYCFTVSDKALSVGGGNDGPGLWYYGGNRNRRGLY